MWKQLPIIIILLTTPAYACHKFSIWHYRFPQSCKVVAYIPIHLHKAPTPKINWPPMVFIRNAWELDTEQWNVPRLLGIEQLKKF